MSRTTALNSAIMMERAEAVRELLVHGAGVETVDRAGWAPLHWAVLSGNLVIAREILQHGSQSVRLGQRSESGTTPLHFAAAKGDDGMVELLLENGASLSARDNFGVSAVEHAAVGGWSQTVKLLGGGSDIDLGCCSMTKLRWRIVEFRRHTIIQREKVWAGLIFDL